MPNNIIKVDACGDQQRLDNFLQKHLKKLPKSFLYRLMRTGQVRVNSKRVKAHRKLEIDDLVRFPPHLSALQKTTEHFRVDSNFLAKLKSWIIYEDDDLFVIDKPPGMPVHAGSSHGAGLIELIKQEYNPTAYLVHRIDKGTSGCLLIAKNRQIATQIQLDFKHKKVDKIYQMAVDGNCSWQQKIVELALKKQQLANVKQLVLVDAQGKSAKSVFTKIANFNHGNNNAISFLEGSPITGRTHQLRVHLASINHSIIGDILYSSSPKNIDHKNNNNKKNSNAKNNNKALAKPDIKRLCLHAHAISFSHPSKNKTITIKSAYNLFDQLAKKFPLYFNGYLHNNKIIKK